MAELDIFGNSLEDLLGNALAAEVPSSNQATTYYIITSNAKGGAASPFTGDTAQVKEVTEAELKKIYQDSGQIQDHFKSFDNYKQYIVESQDWVKSADWMNATVQYGPEDPELLYQLREDVMYAPGERERIQQKIDSDLYSAKMSAWYNWLGEGKELMDKWGLNNTIYNSDGDQFRWTGSGYQKTIKIDDHADFGDYLKVGIAAGFGLALGPAIAGSISSALGVSSGLASGALSGAVGSVISQGIANGKIELDNLVAASILGGIGGLADDLAAGISQTGAIPNAIDNAIWDLSGTLKLSYDETLNILKGITTGAITGSDLESMALNAVGSFTTSHLVGFIKDELGDTLDIENWFKEGDANIPVEAFTPLISTAVQGIIDGSVSDVDAIKAIYGYFSEGGNLDFLVPPGVSIPSFVSGLGITLPELDIDLPELDIDLPEVDLPEVDIDLPEVDIDLPEVDIDLPEVDLPEVDIDLPEVDLPEVDLPEVDVDLPSVDVPSVDVDLPSVDLPSVDLPSVDLPSSGQPSQPTFKTQDIKGLSYQSQQVPGYISTNNIDAAAALKQFVQSNLKQNSTMNSLFKELIG